MSLKFQVSSFRLVMVALALVGAGSVNAQKLKVVCTTTIIYDIAKNIAGDKAEVISFLPIGGDPHIYDAVPDDIQIIANADLILRNGLHLEGWLDKVIVTSGNDAPVETVTIGITPRLSTQYHGAPDPHVWMSVPNGIIMANNITNALVRLLPVHSTLFEDNLRHYTHRLEQLDREIAEKTATIPESVRILVTTHDAFYYYAQRYGFQVESIQGISTDAEIIMSDAQRVRDVIRANNLPAIFIESTINPKVFHEISKDMKVKIGGELFADSVGDEDTEAGTYIGMLRHNTEIIVNGLTGRAQGLFRDEANYRFLLVVLVVFGIAFTIVAARVKLKNVAGLGWKSYEIVVENLSVSYDRKTVLTGINLVMPSAQVYGVIGPNGSGKSTLFKSMLALVEPDSGRVTINGYQIERLSKYTAYIPQKEEIDFDFPATVFDVVLNGRYPHKKVFSRISAADRALAEDALRKVDMLDFRSRQIGQLSGGQQQRVFLARALAQDAEVLLLDEPFSGVDVTTEERMIELLRELARHGKTVLVVHHDLSDVKEYFDRVIMLNQRLIAYGPTKETFTDENIRKCYHGRSTVLEEVGQLIT